MRIKLNDKEMEIFSGARVKDVVMKYSRWTWRQVRTGRKAVFDRYGHEVAPDGELSGGEDLSIRVPEKRERGS